MLFQKRTKDKAYIAKIFFGSLAVLLLILALGLWQRARSSASETQRFASITLDGEEVYSVDLSIVTKTTTFTIGDADNWNLIQVSPDGIGVIESNCPDQVCVKQGIHAHGPEPIVCLPHKLSIRFSADNPDDLDAVTGR